MHLCFFIFHLQILNIFLNTNLSVVPYTSSGFVSVPLSSSLMDLRNVELLSFSLEVVCLTAGTGVVHVHGEEH